MYGVACCSPNCAAQVAKGKITRTACSPIRLLRSGGALIYRICRLKPEENQQLVERLLEEFPRIAMRRKILPPFRDRYDGAFAARLIRSLADKLSCICRAQWNHNPLCTTPDSTISPTFLWNILFDSSAMKRF